MVKLVYHPRVPRVVSGLMVDGFSRGSGINIHWLFLESDRTGVASIFLVVRFLSSILVDGIFCVVGNFNNLQALNLK